MLLVVVFFFSTLPEVVTGQEGVVAEQAPAQSG